MQWLAFLAFPVETLKQTPRVLAAPLLIFDSATVSGSLVAMVALKDPDGAILVVPLRLNKRPEGYVVNEISSVYGRKQHGTQKPNNQWFINQAEEGRLRYIDTKKLRQARCSRAILAR
ncbi:hypothetical protein [Aminobacterium mobile]|uniref:MuF-C-terminal domain-containing protein n=1 Tax=Aminobacterium mobile TaxID=81467 RepID=UPI0004636729|nr:hypothetical protein [Aminobacterium mobile]